MSRRSDPWWRDEPDFFDSPGMRGRTVRGARCYESHKPLELGDTGLVIHGGSCGHPVVTDADIYIGFDASMSFSRRHWPWLPGHEVLFRITDMQAPDDPKAFRQLVDWTAHRLLDGAKVHAGCVGGHGRTGLFLAALLQVMTGERDATTRLRETYCTRAVESAAQVAFLERQFGVTPVPPAKGPARSRTASPSFDDLWDTAPATGVGSWGKGRSK